MSEQMKIDVALANLEAGNFSFLMIDAIKDHIRGLENELELVRGLHGSAMRDLKRIEFTNWRLEEELKKLNAKIYLLLKANLLTEKAYAGLTVVALKTGAYFAVSKKFAEPALQQVMADVESGKLQSQGVDAAAKIYALLKEIMPTQSTVEEMKPYAQKSGEYFAVAWKFAAATFEWVMADVKSDKLQSRCADAAAKTYALLKSIMPTQSTVEEMKPYAQKSGEYFAVAWKFVAAQLEKASAYLATLNKTAA